MDSVLTPYLTELAIAPNKQNRIKIPKKNRSNFISNIPSGNFDSYAGLLNPPPPHVLSSSSYPLSAHLYHYQQNQQPPLLPLPNNVSSIHQQPLMSRSPGNQGLFCPKNRNRGMSLTPKKSKPTMREEVVKKRATQSISEFLTVASDNGQGPYPNDIPVVLTSLSRSKGFGTVSTENIDDMFSDSVFNLSPPPSSLPMPKFSVRSKLSCNAQAAGIDNGATDNLRRLLRLL